MASMHTADEGQASSRFQRVASSANSGKIAQSADQIATLEREPRLKENASGPLLRMSRQACQAAKKFQAKTQSPVQAM